MIQVVKSPFNKPETFYIGRGSAMGNPYSFQKSNHSQVRFEVKDRDEAVDKFGPYLEQELRRGNPEICEFFKKLQVRHFRKEDIYLRCFCKPLRCHGDIIKELLENSKYIINWFSNMRPFDDPIVFRGIKYQTPENFYQAMKTLNQEDQERISKVSPHKSKSEGK